MQIHYWQRSLLLLQHPLFVLHTMRYSCVVGWLGVIRIVTDVMESENTKNSHRINMKSFPLSDETWQNYGPIDRWIEWYRCIFAPKEVCGNLAGEEFMRRVCFGEGGMNKQNEWFRDWWRCTDCLLSEMKGVESHARDRSMDKMGGNDCLWWCRDEGERERVVFGVNGLVMSLKY